MYEDFCDIKNVYNNFSCLEQELLIIINNLLIL